MGWDDLAGLFGITYEAEFLSEAKSSIVISLSPIQSDSVADAQGEFLILRRSLVTTRRSLKISGWRRIRRSFSRIKAGQRNEVEDLVSEDLIRILPLESHFGMLILWWSKDDNTSNLLLITS